jgi:AbrB family looped-hinge helix DNA binding protein
MTLVKVRYKYQVTLPQDVRDELQLVEGDLLEASVENHMIVLKPKAVVDRHIDETLAPLHQPAASLDPSKEV